MIFRNICQVTNLNFFYNLQFPINHNFHQHTYHQSIIINIRKRTQKYTSKKNKRHVDKRKTCSNYPSHHHIHHDENSIMRNIATWNFRNITSIIQSRISITYHHYELMFFKRKCKKLRCIAKTWRRLRTLQLFLLITGKIAISLFGYRCIVVVKKLSTWTSYAVFSFFFISSFHHVLLIRRKKKEQSIENSIYLFINNMMEKA